MEETPTGQRMRLSAAGMRAFANIAKRWGLSHRPRQSLLECQPINLERWKRIARQLGTGQLASGTDNLWRKSAALGVFSHLRQFLTSAEAGRLGYPTTLANCYLMHAHHLKS